MIIYREEKIIVIKENDKIILPKRRDVPISSIELHKNLKFKELVNVEESLNMTNKDPLNMSNKDPLNMSNKDPIDFINNKNKNIELEHIYIGLPPLEEYLMIIYLLKYCTSQFGNYTFHTVTDNNISGIFWRENDLEIYLPKDFTIKAQENSKRFLIEFITLESETDAHSNVLIYDKKNHILEIYDPNGTTKQFSNQFLLYECIFEFFRRIFKNDIITFITNKKGIQTNGKAHSSGSDGFCAMWTLLYTELRITFPDYEPAELQEIMSQETEKIGKIDYIYNFSKYFELFSRKFHVDNKHLIKMYNKKYIKNDEDLERLYYHDMITDIQKEDNQEIRRSKRNRPNL
jgi:hypothetical protein